MKNIKYVSLLVIVVVALSIVVAGPVFAKNVKKPLLPNKGNTSIVGTVSAVSGTTLTVTGRVMPKSTTPAPNYTVDASSATVRKDNTASNVSAIAVGDTVRVQGTRTGTNIVAKIIIDGVIQPVKKVETNKSVGKVENKPKNQGLFTASLMDGIGNFLKGLFGSK